ncbi:hypothetical protein LshimejAT787_0212530 [Lyophyllum shimeji]|uniref:Uncharacterized protein n=1 Tax=Lyophyllum shimeji TaxID=47721 RepID=A0A9P3PHR9_LYOSH|nr:hypothetical protein LshimejAT787_0212530 [Lyophyllum shimeji]
MVRGKIMLDAPVSTTDCLDVPLKSGEEFVPAACTEKMGVCLGERAFRLEITSTTRAFIVETASFRIPSIRDSGSSGAGGELDPTVTAPLRFLATREQFLYGVSSGYTILAHRSLNPTAVLEI